MTRFTDTKVFLGRGVGILHWGLYPELIDFESHDLAMAASILGDGWIDGMLARCRTGAALQGPGPSTATSQMLGSGFEWCVVALPTLTRVRSPERPFTGGVALSV